MNNDEKKLKAKKIALDGFLNMLKQISVIYPEKEDLKESIASVKSQLATIGIIDQISDILEKYTGDRDETN